MTPSFAVRYQKIVVVLNETIRLMQEIDKVIEAHSGWPGAFQAGEAKAATPSVTKARKCKPATSGATPPSP